MTEPNVAYIATPSSVAVAILETDRCFFKRYNMPMVALWLKSALHTSGKSQTALARELNARLNRSFDRSTVNKMVLGKRQIAADEMIEIARITSVPLPTIEELEPFSIPLLGYVGADNRPDVIAFSEGHGNLANDIPVPPNATRSTGAIEVRGDSMRAFARNGWLVYYDSDKVQGPPFDNLIGETCVCWLNDGRVLLKEINRGRESGLYDLESLNADTMRDVAVNQAALITFIRPRGRKPQSDSLNAMN